MKKAENIKAYYQLITRNMDGLWFVETAGLNFIQKIVWSRVLAVLVKDQIHPAVRVQDAVFAKELVDSLLFYDFKII